MPHAHFPDSAGGSFRRGLTVLTLALALALGALTALARPADAATSTGLLNLRSAVVELTNVARATKGCKPLRVSVRLTNAAQAHAKDMSKYDYFSHTSRGGRTWDSRIERYGWKYPGGENIARGFSSPTGVVKAWIRSPGHKRNIMDCSFRYIGIGYVADGGYWVQDFGYKAP